MENEYPSPNPLVPTFFHGDEDLSELPDHSLGGRAGHVTIAKPHDAGENVGNVDRNEEDDIAKG